MAAQLELERLRAEVTEKDALLETMQKTLRDNANTVDELMRDAKQLASRAEAEYKVQLEVKSKELSAVRALLAEAQSEKGSPSRSPRFQQRAEKKSDRSFMDDYLITVLEQKDKLADELHARTCAYAELKSQLGMAEFEKERLLAECRAQSRALKKTNSDGAASDSGSLGEADADDEGGLREMGETLETVRAERDKLANSLADMNRTVQQLRDRMGGDERTLRESERRRRKEAHKSSISIRAKAQLDELDKENKRLTAEVKRCEKAEELVRELREQVASKESMLRDRDAAVAAADEELVLLRSLIGSTSKDRSASIELEAKIAAAEKAAARLEGERDAAAAAATREREGYEARIAELAAELDSARNRAGDASTLEVKLEAAAAATAQAAMERQAAAGAAANELKDLEATFAKERAQLESRITELTTDLEDAHLTAKNVTDMHEAEMVQERTDLEATFAEERSKLEGRIAELTANLDVAHTAADKAVEVHQAEIKELEERSLNAKSMLAQAEAETAKAAMLRSEYDTVRRDAEREMTKVHDLFLREQDKRKVVQNLLMEFVGNIRVFARVRPATKVGAALVKASSKMVMQTRYSEHKRDFEFDRAFADKEQATDVFNEVQPLVPSFLDGFNVCILAYGQTGSGKTHTMFGPPADHGMPEMSGIIPRAVAEIFALRAAQVDTASIKIQVSVLEVYNEAVRDLLSAKPWEKHDVTDASGNGAEVLTAIKADVSSQEEVLKLVANGLANRVERKTDLNDHSSRSHLVLTVHSIRKSLMADGVTTESKMHLVDLAGSENAKLAGSVGDGLTEGKNINKSLSALSGVMQALAAQKGGAAKQHVPYRNSKLTYLLKDAIGGDAKTVMFVCVRPEESFAAESMQTLRFGSQARCISKGPAQRHVIQKMSGELLKGGGSPKSMRSPKFRKKSMSKS
mmetsp:Transcript_35936/g.94217  ORF Transcript_35936/g.94217 Transcript_35936/m.94217 type:complete len:927 (+) Transcript_35936:37-2817(+)